MRIFSGGVRQKAQRGKKNFIAQEFPRLVVIWTGAGRREENVELRLTHKSVKFDVTIVYRFPSAKRIKSTFVVA